MRAVAGAQIFCMEFLYEKSYNIENKHRLFGKVMTMKKIPPYNPTNDLIFKFVFGREERKHVTLTFINDMLGRTGKDAFVDLSFRNAEFVPTTEDEKQGRLDIFGVLDDQTRVDLEMQVFNHMNMEKRSLFYWSQMYLHFEGLKSGDDYLAMKPAIALNILRYAFLPQDEPFSRYVVYDPAAHHRLSDDFEMDFLEIPKYKNKPVKEMTRMERWLAYFANKLDALGKEELAMATPEIGEAIEASDKFVIDEMEYRKYLQRESAIWDYNTDMRGSRQQGYNEGYGKGVNEGVEKKACEMVDEMLAEKFPLSQIAKISKWPLEKVEAYAKERHHEQ